MLNYCVQDVKLNEAVYKFLQKEGLGFSKQSFDLEQMTSAIICEQERNGFYFDSKQAMTLLATQPSRYTFPTSARKPTASPEPNDVRPVLGHKCPSELARSRSHQTIVHLASQ